MNESSSYDVVVIGAGVAGSAVALLLARAGHSVLLLESESYPVHKMCGEFLSPETREAFRALGVDAEVEGLNPVPIRRVAITSRSGAVWHGRLPGEALGLSRWALDPALFDAAVRAGAEGRQGAPVRSIDRDADGHHTVTYSAEGGERSVRARRVIGAYGKRSRLDKRLDRDDDVRRAAFVAFKMHYDGDDLDDWVELHAFDGGYCGMSAVEGGRVNACMIAAVDALRESGSSFEGMRDGVLRSNRALAERLDRLSPAMERPISIARITFASKPLFSRGVMMVGDTAGMIAPLCGDGMAMALRSAQIAAPLVNARLRGEIDEVSLCDRYRRAWRSEFAGRLRLGRALQAGLFRPRVARAGLAVLDRVPALGRFFVRATRGPTVSGTAD